MHTGRVSIDDPDGLIQRLGLEPHPEGGWFRETWRAEPTATGERSAGTAIYFLLRAGESSHWHRIDAAEIWHHYAGGPLRLRISLDGIGVQEHLLGPDVEQGQTPQVVVPAHAWQAAEPLDDAVLVGCTVSPGFEFAHFHLAPPCWEPGTNMS